MVSAVGILGAGRQALETAGYCRELGLDVTFFLEESPPLYARDESAYSAPILRFGEDACPMGGVAVITAVGSSELRRRLIGRWMGQDFHTLVSPAAWVARDARVGVGATIAPLASLNRAVEVGDHALVNVGAILSHDVVVGDFSTISPGCTVGGGARIGSGVFIGIGATIIDHVALGDGAIVAAGAVVVNDIDANQKVMGVPARSPREAPS